MRAAILELDTRAGNQVLDGARNEHLARLGEGGDARPDVNGDAARFAVNELALAAVQPSAYVQVEGADGLLDREGAVDSPCRAVEGGEEAVADGVHFLAAVAPQLRADGLVMLLQQLAPGAVAQLGRPRGGTNDVREENRREDPVRLGFPRLPFDDVLQKALQRREEAVRIAELGRKVSPG